MPFGPVSAFAGPVLLEPDPSPGFTMSMQPLHKLALHDVRQRDGVAPRDSHNELVERLVACRTSCRLTNYANEITYQ